MRCLLLFALAASSAARAAEPTLPFEVHKLGNGLTVILSEDHRLPQVAVDVWSHVGAPQQAKGRSGFAHLFEHIMLFAGTKNVPNASKVLEQGGTVLGPMANGTTNLDRTNYFETVASADLPVALWIESDRMGYLADALTEEKLKVQRDVVSNERRQGNENRPFGLSELRGVELAYPEPHPYHLSVIGSIAEIQAASIQDLRDFFHANYGPNNASLAIVGDFEPKEALALVNRYFGGLPRGPEVRHGEPKAAPIPSVIKDTLEDSHTQVSRLELIYSGTQAFAADEPALDVLADLLGGGKSSRLHKALVVDKQVAESAFASDETSELGGVFMLVATATQGHGKEDLLAPMEAVIAAVKESGPTAEEVERSKRKIEAQLLRNLEKLGGFGGKADQLNNYQIFTGDPGYLPKDLARYRAVTVEAVRDAARRYLPPERRIELYTVPAAKAAKGGAQ